MRKNFIYKNEEFECEHCKKLNPLLKGTCRNHCKFCLFSKHVDKNVPGDRESSCKSLMEPVFVDKEGKKGYVITHKCTKCSKEIRNKVVEDDDFDVIINLSLKQRQK